MSDDTVQRSKEKADAPHPEDSRKPDGPSEVSKPSWKYIIKRAISEFSKDNVTDLAAALT